MDEIVVGREYGDCSLLIYGDCICFREIEKVLDLNPTRTVKKGQPLFKVSSERICQTNGWFYSVEFNDRDDLSNALDVLLSHTHPRKDILKRLAEKFEGTDIYIKISVISDYAQMSFKMKPKHQKLISEIGFPLYFSIFSFGMVEDDGE